MDRQQMVDEAITMVAESFPDIAAVLRTTPIRFGRLTPGNKAMFHASDDTNSQYIKIDDGIVNNEVVDLAGTLVHEGTHALDAATGVLHSVNVSPNQLVSDELRAYTNELSFIQAKYPNGLPEKDDYDIDVNKWVNELRNGTLESKIRSIYAPNRSTNPWFQLLTAMMEEERALQEG